MSLLLRREEDADGDASPENDTENNRKFPEGLRVLAVDDNVVCLKLLEIYLKKCGYEAIVTTDANTALKLLREKGNNIDIVITDVRMPNVDDGFKLLEIIGLEMDIPVVMVSDDDDRLLVMKGIEHGACNYLLKPVRLEEIKTIWQHVVRKTKFSSNDSNVKKENQGQPFKATKRERDETKEETTTHVCTEEYPSEQKKQRVSWNRSLQAKFMDAFNELGPDKAVPSKLLEKMNVPGLTRDHVASHLQKYRAGLKKSISQQYYGVDAHNPNNAFLSFDNQRQGLLNHFRGVNFEALKQFENHCRYPHNYSSLVNTKMVPSSSIPPTINIRPQSYVQGIEQLDPTYQLTQFHTLPNAMTGQVQQNLGLPYLRPNLSNTYTAMPPNLFPTGGFTLPDYSTFGVLSNNLISTMKQSSGQDEGNNTLTPAYQNSSRENNLLSVNQNAMEMDYLGPKNFFGTGSCSSSDGDLKSAFFHELLEPFWNQNPYIYLGAHNGICSPWNPTFTSLLYSYSSGNFGIDRFYLPDRSQDSHSI